MNWPAYQATHKSIPTPTKYTSLSLTLDDALLFKT
jgi:hypothetical protein